MKHIISVSLGSSLRDYSFTTTVLGQHIAVRRIGTNGDIRQAAELVRQHDGRAHAICLEGITPVLRINRARYPHPRAGAVVAQAQHSPVVDGSMLRDVLERWVARRAADILPRLFRYRRILFTSGIIHYQMAQALSQYEADIRFADPIMHAGLPFAPVPRTLSQLELYAAMVLPIAALLPYRPLRSPRHATAAANQHLQRLFYWADVIIGDFDTIQRAALRDLRGRTIITNDPSHAEIEELRSRGLSQLVTLTPPLSQEHPFVSVAVLEAIITVVQECTGQPDEAGVLDFISVAGWEPTVQQLGSTGEKSRFAFVIHPLKVSHITKDPRFGFTRYLPRRLVEWSAAYVPPLYLAKARGIRSQATGQEIEGLLFTLGATPREILRRSPEFTYRRLIRAARMAERRGARIMGLGAFTSVVGDAGVTVAQKTDIGITSGNSLTVAATLESAKVAVRMMGGRTDQGRAVVIGATGSIGAVCARLLAQAIGDVVLIAPRPERLLALKQVIEQETPGARVTAATSADAYLGEADLIVTTTSALTGRVINIDRLKPGAVVCDVARPPDVRPEDAARRPDVLVIESGEILLPGEPDLGFDIDLPAGTAYACLAETALLTMEGKFEDYTLGREIEIERVKEMYRLMKKHGLQLAGLRSFDQYITEEVIAEKRRLADELRQKSGQPQPLAQSAA